MEPIRIGWLGSALDGPGGGYDKIHRMAFDEAEEQGLLDRPVEFVIHPENGLPQGTAKNATDGFRSLVEEGSPSSTSGATFARATCSPTSRMPSPHMPPAIAANCATYDDELCGATMVCVCAPPSDHPTNW